MTSSVAFTPPTAPTPQAAEAFNQANAAYRAGDWMAALAGYSAALGLQGQFADAALQRARCLVALGRTAEAREAFAQTLRLDAQHYSAWLEAGHLCRQQGVLQQAAGAYARAMAVAPQRHEAALALFRVLAQAGQAEPAEQALAQALSNAALLGPARLLDVQRRAARYRLEGGDAAGAQALLASALRSHLLAEGDEAVNDRAELQIDLGEALMRQGRPAEGQALLSQASGATRESTLARLAELSYRHNLWAEAIAVCRRNLALHPVSPQAHWNLAQLLTECWQMEEGLRLLTRAEALAPMPGATRLRASVASRTGDADAALAHYLAEARAAIHRSSGTHELASSAAMCALYSDRLSSAEVAALHRELFAPLSEGARARASFKRAPLAGRRLRVGLVSADFHHQHPVNLFMQPVLRELDRRSIELSCYFVGVSHDGQTQLAQARTEHWVEATYLNDAQLAGRIDADQIDVLVDLSGHTGQQRMALFGRRAAPVQCTYLAYPGSTGVPTMDWMLTDATVTPPGSESLYSEQLWRLPGQVFCYAPEEDYVLPPMPDSLAARPLTFASFNNVPKLTPSTLALWAAVLAAVPGSRLLLKAPSFGDAAAVKLFGDKLVALGVAPERLEFRGPVGLADMMAEYADVDIALDPTPYNGGTTSLQAMWMGAPVLTLEGGHFVSRMGASFMRNAGLDDWVAQDEADYIAMARRMAADRPALLALKRGMRQRLLARPAWDVQAHTRAMEAALWGMASEGLDKQDDPEIQS
ncbi:MAG: hypothetical protein RLZZ618_2607 [Pseudomonadota bacterium]|jgi:predicted O-linked N-acetylglucosamine transferase (SPINDLY family)